MKQKNLSILIILIFTLICATILIGFNYYNETTTTFNNFFKKTGVKLVSNVGNSYLELKNSLKEKYSNKLNNKLDEISLDYNNGINEILGENYKKYTLELDTVRREIKEKKSNFLNSKEYLDKKQEMLDIKEKLDKAEGEEYDKLYESFQKALSEISTLNVKLNNSLKELKSKHDNIYSNLTILFENNKEKLINFRNEHKKVVSECILKIINEYNFELSELNCAFNVNQNKMREFPFDIDFFGFKCVSSAFESEYFSESTEINDESSTKIEFVDTSFNKIN